MTAPRTLAAAGLVLLVAVLQLSVLSQASWHGVVPNLVLLVVVGVGLVRDAQAAMVLGFVSGLLLDLAPPADHVAGRWALALLAAGYVAGLVSDQARTSPGAVVATVAACSLLGTSVFALTGLVLGEPVGTVPDVLGVLGVALVLDVLVAPLVLPLVMRVFGRPETARAGL